MAKMKKKKSMGLDARWHFPDSGGGLVAGFNDGAMDHFKGKRFSSVVREVIQNSLDASANGSKPVRVYFRLEKIKNDRLSAPIQDIRNPIKLARKTACKQNSIDAVKFYDKALEELKKNTLHFLCIHDDNTKGLTGPVEGPIGSWFALTKGSGLSQKNLPDSLGSYGHGSKAPFTLSLIRSVFYYTKFTDNSTVQERFQGKSILQSFISPETKRLTQGTGFYGDPSSCSPLENELVPRWAIDFRANATNQLGTSIFIPATFYKSDLYPDTAVTALANFFFAIHCGFLEVYIDDNIVLKKENVEKMFMQVKSSLPEEQDEIDANLVSDCFESIETIVNPNEKGTQEVPGFGLISWYLRIGGNIQWRRVAIARQNGMLITHNAPELRRFPKTKYFDMFICVQGADGSEILKEIENPRHDNFQFERIDDKSRLEEIKRRYKTFSNKIREIIERHAGLSLQDEIVADELSELFGEISETNEKQHSSRERSSQVVLVSGPQIYRPPQPPRQSKPGNDLVDIIEDPNSPKDPSQSEPNGDGTAREHENTVIDGAQNPNKNFKGKHFRLERLRIRKPEIDGGDATVYFDAPDTGKYIFKLLQSGEVGTNSVAITLPDGSRTNSIMIDIEKHKRESVAVKIDAKFLEFTLVAEIYESTP